MPAVNAGRPRRTAAPRVVRAAPRRLTAAPTVNALRRSRPEPRRSLSASPVSTRRTNLAAESPDATPSSRRRTPTLRASARAAVSRRSLTASPVQTALQAAEHGEQSPIDSQTGLPRVATPRRPAARHSESVVDAPVGAARTRVDMAVSPRRSRPVVGGPDQQLIEHDAAAATSDAPASVAKAGRRAAAVVSATAKPVRRAEVARELAEEDAPPAARGQRQPATVRAAERGQEAIVPVASAATPARRTRRASTPLSDEVSARPSMAIRAVARGEKVVRRSASGAMLSPTVLGHVANEPEAVEAAVVGRPGRRVAATRRPVEQTGALDAQKTVTVRADQSATERASRRGDSSEAATPTTSRRGVLAPVPTAYLEPAVPESEGEAQAEMATRSRRDRPTVRAAARATTTTDLNDSGSAVLTQAPTRYIGVARDSGQESIVSSPVQRAARIDSPRRRPALAQPQTLIAGDDERSTQVGGQVERPAATARVRQRGVAASRPQVTRSRARWTRSPGQPVRQAPALAQGKAAIPSSPTARAAARREPQAMAPRRSTLSRAVNRSDLQFLVAEEIRQLSQTSTTPSAPLRRVLKTLAPAVQASGRIGRSIVTVDAARRAVGDARGRRPNVVARLVETPEGRIVRGEARRITAPAGRRPLASPETVVLGANDFDAPAQSSPVEWSERRMGRRSSPSIRAATGPSRVPAVRAAQRVEGPSRFRPRASGQSPAATGRTVRGRGDRFTPAATIGNTRRAAVAATGTLPGLAPETASEQGRVSDAGRVPGRRRRSRPLDRTMGYLGTTASAEAGAASGVAPQLRGRRGSTRSSKGASAPEAIGLDSPEYGFDEPEAPGWARRAVEGTPVSALSQLRPQSRARVGGSLLSALARATNAEDVVQVILERSTAGVSGELPAPAAQLVRRISRAADAENTTNVQPRQRDDRRAERGQRVPVRGVASVRRNVLRPQRVSFSSGPAESTARSGQGVGASNVMKLANKLMSLIHLAENQRKSDAQSQVRMAEDTAQARAEGGLGASQPKDVESETMNIQTLQQEVLESVLSAIELLQERREGDPDGRNEWW